MTSVELSPPSGTVTFLFSDVVGSTRLWARDAAAMSTALEVHDGLVRAAIEGGGGYVFTTAGDAFAAAFGSTDAAVDCAVAIQARLGEAGWPTEEPLQVRIGLHVGAAVERGGDYFGPVLNTAARVESAAQPGQVLATAAVRELSGRPMRSLGEHRLRDLVEPLELFQIGDGEFGPVRSLDGVVSTLPSMANRLIGRAEEVGEVRRLLEGSRLVTITGVGGCGKTRLAVEVGGRELPEVGAVFFVDLTTVNDPDEVVAGVGLSLAGATEPLDGLLEYLRSRSALLVLDNCEHVLDPVADLVEDVLANCPSVRVLATSREALEIDGEQAWRIPSLSGGEGSAGFQLFVERAHERNASFALTGPQRAAVVEICEGLDGIPLAIELAAARTIAMPVEEIRDRLGDRFRLLSGGRRRRSRQRQQTLSSVVQWSHDLLDVDEQMMLRRLAVFSGGFDIADVPGVTGFGDYDAFDLIESLAAKSLIDTGKLSEGRPRFRLLETIRLYALDRLETAGELEQVRDAHRDNYLANPVHESVVLAFTDPVSLRRQVVEIDNVCAAIDWAIDTDQQLLAALSVARNTAAMNATGFGHRYIDLIGTEFSEATPGEQAALIAMRVNLACLGFVGEERMGFPGRQARELFETGLFNDDLFMALMMNAMFDADATAEGMQPAMDAARDYSEVSEAGMSWGMASLHLREDRFEEAINGLSRCYDLTPQSRTGAEAGFHLCLTLAAIGRNDEAAAVAESMSPVPGSFVYGPSLAVAAAGVGTGNQNPARELAQRARNEVTGRIVGQEGEYLLLFAWFHHDAGNDGRAAALLSGLQTRTSPYETVILDQLVNQWPRQQWTEQMRAAAKRTRDLPEVQRRLALNPQLLTEEIAYWS